MDGSERGSTMASRKGLQPTQVIAGAFTVIILLGTVLLMLPIASRSGAGTGFFDALFTSTSAVTVTGLGTLDTETHWSIFGHWTLAFLIQLGGFGIVGFASLVGYLLEGRISLKNKMTTASEASIAIAPDVKTLLKNIAKLMLGFQFVLFIFLFFRFLTKYEYSWQDAVGHGIFHSIASFNNAGCTASSSPSARKRPLR